MARYRIITPEQVVFHYETAGFASRAVAWILDQALVTILRLAALYSLAGAAEFGIAVIILAFFLLDFAYFTLFELYWAGQSPGKRHMGLRVISAGGGKLNFSQTFLRNLLRAIDSLPAVMTLGGAAALLDPYGRRLGDLAADTLVAIDSKRPLPSQAGAKAGRANTFLEDPALRNRIWSRATRQERDLIFDLVIRREELDSAAREELFRRMAALIRARYNLPENMEFLSDEQTTLNVALTLEAAKAL